MSGSSETERLSARGPVTIAVETGLKSAIWEPRELSRGLALVWAWGLIGRYFTVPPGARRSGCGKSAHTARQGRPILRLDVCNKEGADPPPPLLPNGIGTDWDSPLSWNADAALAAVAELCATGKTSVPVYDISTSSIT